MARNRRHMSVSLQKKMRKELTERAPIYCEKNAFAADGMRRVVSRPNGLWRAERKEHESGTRERDCWTPLSGDIPFMDAANAMNTYHN